MNSGSTGRQEKIRKYCVCLGNEGGPELVQVLPYSLLFLPFLPKFHKYITLILKTFSELMNSHQVATNTPSHCQQIPLEAIQIARQLLTSQKFE